MGNILSVLKARSLGCVLNVLRSGEQWLAASLAIRSALQSRRALWWWTYLGAPLDLRHLILICLTGAPEKEMATHSRIIAWRISWTEEPGRLQSMGSQRIRHEWTTKHSTKTTSVDSGSSTSFNPRRIPVRQVLFYWWGNQGFGGHAYNLSHAAGQWGRWDSPLWVRFWSLWSMSCFWKSQQRILPRFLKTSRAGLPSLLISRGYGFLSVFLKYPMLSHSFLRRMTWGICHYQEDVLYIIMCNSRAFL